MTRRTGCVEIHDCVDEDLRHFAESEIDSRARTESNVWAVRECSFGLVIEEGPEARRETGPSSDARVDTWSKASFLATDARSVVGLFPPSTGLWVVIFGIRICIAEE